MIKSRAIITLTRRAGRTLSAKMRCLQPKPSSASLASTLLNSRTCSQPRSRTRSRFVASLPLTPSVLHRLPSRATVPPDKASRECITRLILFSKRTLRARARSSRSSLQLASILSHEAHSEVVQAVVSTRETTLKAVSLPPRSVLTTLSR